MWHASVSPRFLSVTAAADRLWEIAVDVLRGVGDPAHEWREIGDRAVHLRRRLTMREERAAGITGVVDVRGTDEQKRRIAAMRPYLPAAFRGVPAEQLP